MQAVQKVPTEADLQDSVADIDRILEQLRRTLAEEQASLKQARDRVREINLTIQEQNLKTLRGRGDLHAPEFKLQAEKKRLESEIIEFRQTRIGEATQVIAERTAEREELNRQLAEMIRLRIQDYAKTLVTDAEQALLEAGAKFAIASARALGVHPSMTAPADMCHRVFKSAISERRFQSLLDAVDQSLSVESAK